MVHRVHRVGWGHPYSPPVSSGPYGKTISHTIVGPRLDPEVPREELGRREAGGHITASVT